MASVNSRTMFPAVAVVVVVVVVVVALALSLPTAVALERPVRPRSAARAVLRPSSGPTRPLDVRFRQSQSQSQARSKYEVQLCTNVQRFQWKLPAVPAVTDMYPAEMQDNGEEDSEFSVMEVERTAAAVGVVTVDLYSLLHIADEAYYSELNRRMSDYDVVLFELITSRDNVLESINDDFQLFRKKLRTKIYSPQAEQLARQYGLVAQTEKFDMQQERWFLADLDAETIRLLEQENLNMMKSNYWRSILGGRTFAMPLLDKFFLPDQLLINSLRFVSWLTPCPELGCVLLDWSRMMPRAGGISRLVLPMMERIAAGDLAQARKLAFAQQLLSGVPDSGECQSCILLLRKKRAHLKLLTRIGAWGGEAMSDTKVRVSERNAECCRVLRGFVSEYQQSILSKKILQTCLDELPELKVAILYGAYHVKDISERLRSEWKATRVPVENGNLVAWSVSGEIQSNGDTVSIKNEDFSDMRFINSRSIATIGLFSALYLFFGAVDWWVLLELITKAIQGLSSSSFTSTSVDAVAVDADVNVKTMQLTLDTSKIAKEIVTNIQNFRVEKLPSDSNTNLLLFLISYSVLYIQRHLFLLRKISAFGIQWDRGLFVDMYDDN